jgi:hypothetical protein
MSKNILGQPVFVPKGYSINEFDVSTGILKPSTIPQQVAQKMPIQRQPRFEIPQVNLGVFDTRMELLKEKYSKDPQYNQMPQLIKLPKDTRISPFELAKKGKTLYDIYNKTQKAKARAEEKKQIPRAEPVDSDTIDRSEFPVAEVGVFEDVEPDEIPMGVPASPPENRDDTKYDDIVYFDLDDEDDLETVFEAEPKKPPVIKDEVKDTSQRGRVRPSRDFGEPETFDIEGVVPSVVDVEQVDTTRDWINDWVSRFDRPDEDPADYSDDWDDMHPIVNHPSSEVHEPYTWRPIQAVDQFGDPFFVPSVLGRVDPMFPTQQAPERQIMEDDPIDEPVNIYL